jgi:hypothetical protein
MRPKIRTIAALAAACAAVWSAGDARAQQGSENCLRLEAQLAGLDRSGARRADPRQIEQAAARQQAELDRTSAYAKGIGCGRRFIFAPDPPAECEPLGARIKQMQINLDRLKSQAAQAAQGGGGDPRRRELLFALARGQCGPQYRLVERRVATAPQQQEKKGFFEMLFGGGRSSEEPRGAGEETVVEPEMDPAETPRVSTFRTVCVRTCDGFFFPISYQTTRNAFNRDEAICRATCPGAEAKLFAYANPGGKIDNASDVEGQPYAKLENAFRYRKEFVAGCSCKPEGMNWAEALSGVEDKTVKKGDIVVDEQTAEEMSRAKSPEERTQIQARAAKARTPAPRPAEAASEQPQPAFAPPPGEPDQTGAARRRQQSEDVIILDQPPLERGGVERRPLDGPNLELIPRD